MVALDPRYAALAAAALRVREALKMNVITDGTISPMVAISLPAEAATRHGDAQHPGKEVAVEGNRRRN